MRRYCRNTSHFKLVSQQADLVIVLLLQLNLSLLELVDLVSYHLHLLDLVANLALDLFGASSLALKLRPEGVEKLIEARIRSRLHPAMGIRPPNGVVHGVPASIGAVRQRGKIQEARGGGQSWIEVSECHGRLQTAAEVAAWRG